MSNEAADAALQRLRESAGRTPPAGAPEMAEILDRLDALEARVEGSEEVHRLAREIRKYVEDKRRELGTLRLWRTGAILAAAAFCGAVITNFLIEAADGFPSLAKFNEQNSIPVAAFVSVSFGSILALLVVVLRGVFQSIENADADNYLPPHVAELYEALKKLRE